MKYRLGTTDDLDRICEMVNRAIKTMESHGIYQWDEIYPSKEDFRKDIVDGNAYVVYEGTELAALYVLNKQCDEAYQNGEWKYTDDEAYILHRFCVSPEFQNKGIGRQILIHIEEQIREMGYKSIRLDAYSGNPFAQKLYLHNGYRKVGHADLRKGRFDLMEKDL